VRLGLGDVEEEMQVRRVVARAQPGAHARRVARRHHRVRRRRQIHRVARGRGELVGHAVEVRGSGQRHRAQHALLRRRIDGHRRRVDRARRIGRAHRRIVTGRGVDAIAGARGTAGLERAGG
jgi:hypothetical protein